MKNSYDILDNQGFDLETLSPGEIGVEITHFAEKDNKGDPIIELTCRIFWAADSANEDHIEKEFKLPMFFGKKYDQSVRILKDMLKKSGFQVPTWTADQGAPLSVMLPGSLKLLAWKCVPMIGKVTQSTRDGSTRNFFNLVKVCRAAPDSGEGYPDALPDPVPNEMVVEAYNATLEGESIESLI